MPAFLSIVIIAYCIWIESIQKTILPRIEIIYLAHIVNTYFSNFALVNPNSIILEHFNCSERCYATTKYVYWGKHKNRHISGHNMLISMLTVPSFIFPPWDARDAVEGLPWMEKNRIQLSSRKVEWVPSLDFPSLVLDEVTPPRTPFYPVFGTGGSHGL